MDTGQSTTTPFPRRYFLANTAVLFLACFLWGNGPTLSIQGLVPAVLLAGMAVLVTPFLVLPSLAYQGAVYLALKNRLRNRAIWGALFLLPGVALLAFVSYGYIPSVQTRRILSEAELAPLPKSARHVQACSTPGIRGIAGDFLKFEADREDIESFLSASPILKGRESRRYSRAEMRLPGRQDSEPNQEQSEVDHEYFAPNPYAPKWFHQEIAGSGRRYQFQPMDYDGFGELIFNEETNTVFIHLLVD